MRQLKAAAWHNPFDLCTFILLTTAYARADQPGRGRSISPSEPCKRLSEFRRQSQQEILIRSGGGEAQKLSSGVRGPCNRLRP